MRGVRSMASAVGIPPAPPMFKRVSRILALQFTGFVFLLFLVNGSIFLAADFSNARRQASSRLIRDAQFVVSALPSRLDTDPTFPPHLRERVRMVDTQGTTLYQGVIFQDVPFSGVAGMSSLTFQNDPYDVLTAPVLMDGQLRGYVQVAGPQDERSGDLAGRALIFLLVSFLISGIAYVIGLFFARWSLRPAEEMVGRLEQFTQDASHELRTPLAVLGSSLDLALKTKKYQEGLVSAKEDLKEIAGLVERLLELARLDTFVLNLHPVDLSSLARDMADKFRIFAEEKGVRLNAEMEEGVRVQADGPLLRQLIANLLSNAVKFNAKNGVVTMQLGKTFLRIADTGIGIAAADLPRIFNRFYQADTSRSKDGFGLGLALVKRAVDLHGWTIGVESAPGKGTAFTVHFTRPRGSRS
jgi:signal transduction histidine kinase